MKKIVPLIILGIIPTFFAQAAEDDAFVEFKVLKPEIAIKAAISAMNFCQDEGYQVGVSVVDRFGLTQAFIKSRYAGLHVQETATRKAWTSVSFRTPTLSLDESTQPGKEAFGIRFISTPLPLGGGVPIEAEGSIVAGIGVSGAPGTDIDDECARAGIAAIEDDLLGF
ncbi:heme-binding protein [Amylibacter sp.]|nr:heme-binding protein [Amylibacter sp.]MDB4132481.1 heme-binding protein [Amylibacter sp.]MDC1267730.1 heme-binding protein [Amylibacter sp.]MDC3244405.1 heme-binding protein [Amylibacter sp.]MDG1496751.1 heme-binding protein [Amylibacter sp.]